MILAKEFAVPLVGGGGDHALSPTAVAARRRAAARVGPCLVSPRGSGGVVSPGGRQGGAAAGIGMWLRFNGSGGGGDWKEALIGGGGGGYSYESEHDLAIMVSDFVENGSSGAESWCGSDSDSGFSDLAHLADRILLCKQGGDKKENDLPSLVHSLLLSIHESELHSVRKGPCSGSCIRHLLVKLLKYSGYDAAVCTSKWQGFDKVPGGDHEYIDVIISSDAAASERLIIDIDFRSHFEIARAVESYGALLNSLPVVYVGTYSRLKQFLKIMVDAAKYSLEQNSMPLPPWRSLAYLQAKWQSKYERTDFGADQDIHQTISEHEQCIGHLKRLKASLLSEIDAERLLKPIKADKKWRAKFERRCRSLLSS